MEALPDTYREMDREEIRRRIQERKKELGKRLVILGHHYQRQDVIDFSDFRGDSLGLSQRAAAQTDCEFIVFCGVAFMAESAEILRQDHQKVQHPDPDAGCPLAEMADVVAAQRAWKVVSETVDPERVIPVTYMNSDAELKAFCGNRKGAVCTSSNAPRVFQWALTEGEKVFFFPDEHLGRNTARKLGIPKEKILLWDPFVSPADEDIRNKIRDATLILWKGFCHVHTLFSTDHILDARRKYLGAKIVVHPECNEEVVMMADASGSTEYISRYVEEAPAGSTIVVGTEINLVERLDQEHLDKKVCALARSLCPNMFRVDLANLLWTLDKIGEVNRVVVDPEIKAGARKALERMLQLA